MKTVNLKAAVKARPVKKISAKAKRIQQSGSAPYIIYGSEIRVMLVTPSAGGGWILPKGNIAKRMDTLAIERILPRWEEEGIRYRRLFLIDQAIRIMKTEESAEVLRNLKKLVTERMEKNDGR